MYKNITVLLVICKSNTNPHTPLCSIVNTLGTQGEHPHFISSSLHLYINTPPYTKVLALRHKGGAGGGFAKI
jgi:hypothetical protein